MYDSKYTDAHTQVRTHAHTRTRAHAHAHTHTSCHLSLTNSLEAAIVRIKMTILYTCYVALINPRSISIVLEAIHA